MTARWAITRRLLIVAAGATALTTALSMVPAAANGSGGGGGLDPVVEDLNGPRGLGAFHDGRLVYAEGDGSVSLARHSGQSVLVAKLPEGFIAPAVAVSQMGRIYALTPGGPPGSGSNTLYRLPRGDDPVAVADIGAYQVTDPDPYNLADPPEESNPFGVATLPDRSVLVSDAAANDLLRVFPDGDIETVARLKPRTVRVPDVLPDEIDGQPLPPGGTKIPSEAVATSVTVGADGYYYVGELRGFPATPGKSQIWRIKPGSEDAVCDPAHPHRGACQRFADGFTSIVDLAAGRDGSIYVVELVKRSWLQWELGLAKPVGGLFRIHDDDVTELASGDLTLPGGVEVVKETGKVYVTSPVFGPGDVSRVTGLGD